MLQTRSGKRAGAAAVKIAVDLSKEFLATPRQALLTVKPEHLNQLLHPQFAVAVESSTYKDKYIGKGLPASPGAGKICLQSHRTPFNFVFTLFDIIVDIYIYLFYLFL